MYHTYTYCTAPVQEHASVLGRFEAVLRTARERIKWNALYDLVRGGGGD